MQIGNFCNLREDGSDESFPRKVFFLFSACQKCLVNLHNDATRIKKPRQVFQRALTLMTLLIHIWASSAFFYANFQSVFAENFWNVRLFRKELPNSFDHKASTRTFIIKGTLPLLSFSQITIKSVALR
jgi:hypothetical protein